MIFVIIDHSALIFKELNRITRGVTTIVISLVFVLLCPC